MFVRWSEMQFDTTHYSIKACGDWMWEHALAGWRPYFIVIMFKPLNGSDEGVIAQMKRAIERDFYSSLCKRFSRHPNQPSQQDKLPMMWLFPDLPVGRRIRKPRSGKCSSTAMASTTMEHLCFRQFHDLRETSSSTSTATRMFMCAGRLSGLTFRKLNSWT